MRRVGQSERRIRLLLLCVLVPCAACMVGSCAESEGTTARDSGNSGEDSAKDSTKDSPDDSDSAAPADSGLPCTLALTDAEEQILAGAEDRIRAHRMATAELVVRDANGQARANATVEIEQTAHEFLFGVTNSLTMWQRILNSPDDPLVKEHQARFFEFCNYTSMPINWAYYEPKPGEINYALYDDYLKRFDDMGLRVVAHPLVWYTLTPSWMPTECTAMEEAIDKRITDFMTYFGDKLDAVVVCNEPTKPFRPFFADNPMPACIKEAGVIPFTKRRYEVARQAGGTAKLLVNEVSIGEGEGFAELLDALVDDEGKKLYDAIGIQSHMHSGLWPLDGAWAACEGYGTYGVPLYFTELTVLSGTPMAAPGDGFGVDTTPEGECKQARYASLFYTVLFSHPAVAGIKWWNLSDLDAWKQAPAGMLRADMTRKPVYDVLMELTRNQWWTRTQATTSSSGIAQFTGFFGHYQVTVKPQAGQPQQQFELALNKNGKRAFVLTLRP